MTRTEFTLSGAAALLALSLASGAAQAQETEFNIEAQPLVKALLAFNDQSGRTVAAPHVLVADKSAPAVRGTMEPEEALGRMLASSGLKSTELPGGGYTISLAIAEATEPGKLQPASNPVLMAQNQTSAAQNRTTRQNPKSVSDEDVPLEVEEIIVTGTLIRGIAPESSPVVVLDRDDIDRSGFSTTDQLVRSLPQNYAGGANEQIVSGREATDNTAIGSSINLRGLGADSTLVLINGNRLASASGFAGSFVDISTIPLTAIERVEVLTDGASAVYGTDSIAGVVNFILRDDYEGAETKIRYGSVTDGPSDEIQFGQTFGSSWETGSLLFSYEYYEREALPTEERGYAANSDLTPLGGDDFSNNNGIPANVLDPATRFRSVAFAIPGGQDGTSLAPSDFIAGEVNRGNTREGLDILPAIDRHSVFFVGRQELAQNFEVFGEFQFGRRVFENRLGGATQRSITVTESNPFFVSPFPGEDSNRLTYNFLTDFGPRVRTGDVTNHRVVLGARYDFADTWQIEFTGTYNEEETSTSLVNQANPLRLAEALGNNIGQPPESDLFPDFDPTVDGFFNPYADGSNTSLNVLNFIRGTSESDFKGDLWTSRIKADGELWSSPAGAVRMAIGAEYREEAFDRLTVADVTTAGREEVTPNTSSGNRDVLAVFAELLLPIIGSSNTLPGVNQLDLSVSARYEDYSDFGSSTNPKVGLVWSPYSGVTFRGTYGTSFKAPKITDLDEKGQGFIVFPATPDPASPSGLSSALFLFGANPNVVNEESTSRTIGLQIAPRHLEGFRADITYFEIDFEGRIAAPPNPFGFLFQPDAFGNFFERNPEEAFVQSFYDSPFFIGVPQVPAADIDVILDGRVTNFASTEVSGLDLQIDYVAPTDFGRFGLGLNTNYLIQFKNAFDPGQDPVDIVDTVDNPVDLRARGYISWDWRNWGTSIYVNYTDSYTDNISTPERSVDAWTTVDFQLRYDAGGERTGSWAENTALALSIQNLLNEDPPFVNNTSGIGYDPTNASALGPFISLQIRKEW